MERFHDATQVWVDGRYYYVRTWPESEWNDWRDHMEGLIEGLKSSVILDDSPYYPRDPDGTCFARV
jgi:hypothetical protein